MGSVGDGSDWYTCILVYWYTGIQSTQGVITSTLFILWSLFVYKSGYGLSLFITWSLISCFAPSRGLFIESDFLVTPMPPWR